MFFFNYDIFHTYNNLDVKIRKTARKKRHLLYCEIEHLKNLVQIEYYEKLDIYFVEIEFYEKLGTNIFCVGLLLLL